MDKLTTAYVRECLARETYEDSLDPITLQELKERMVTVRVGNWRVQILEVWRQTGEMVKTYHVHMVEYIGKTGVYDEDMSLACLVRRINKNCLSKDIVNDK